MTTTTKTTKATPKARTRKARGPAPLPILGADGRDGATRFRALAERVVEARKSCTTRTTPGNARALADALDALDAMATEAEAHPAHPASRGAQLTVRPKDGAPAAVSVVRFRAVVFNDGATRSSVLNPRLWA